MTSGVTPPPGRLGVTFEESDSEVRLALVGELDLASVEELELQIAAAHSRRPARLVLDLGELAFIDSSGLRTIIQADAAARAAGIDLVLRPGGASIQRVFELTGAIDALHFEAA